ncbi:hypothetical protein COCC4DRAFT_30826 [Bipolaris maydis ATCC 48331]|uniref:Uncharacterized protein n=2 Tax=Cochliobolus heterostrophus TaxID=5016 RepID=M2UG02_COCH5|nr:uncharacterized protein COCC4DRAFT_30826 [Bipolaris maydis ATCC 48331]EMD92656.1 hypothetical protein COCHEDRAFT_1021328 [Bipolaris maydis C5]ENI08352.1 hypothetical protein COCC4DRAFT_30826 [Bipolaris maydis ATCC 48331]
MTTTKSLYNTASQCQHFVHLYTWTLHRVCDDRSASHTWLPAPLDQRQCPSIIPNNQHIRNQQT